jgi:hypothetical protein
MSHNLLNRDRKAQYIIIICIVFFSIVFLLWHQGPNSKLHESDKMSVENTVIEDASSEKDEIIPEVPNVTEISQKSKPVKKKSTADDPYFEELISSLHYPHLKEDTVPLDLTPGQPDPLARQIASQLWANFENVKTITFHFKNTCADPEQKEKDSTGVVHFQKPFFLRKEGRGETVAFRYITNGMFQRRIIKTRDRPEFPEYETEHPDDTDLEKFLSHGMQVNISSLALLMCPPSSFTSLGEERWQEKDCLKIKSNGMVYWIDKASNQIEKVQLLRRGGIVLQEWRNFKYEKVKFKTVKNGSETIDEFLFPSKFDIITTGEYNEEIVKHRTIYDIKVNNDIPQSTFDLKIESFKTEDLWEKEYK